MDFIKIKIISAKDTGKRIKKQATDMKKKKKNCAKHTFDTGIKNVLNKQPLKAQQYEKSNPIKNGQKM